VAPRRHAAQWGRADAAHRDHTIAGRHRLEDAPIETDSVLAIGRAWRREEQDAFRVKSQRHVERGDERPRGDDRAEDEHHRDADLQDRHRTAGPGA
jgi:hypothetical protein